MTVSPFHAASLRARASECEDHRWPAGDGVRNRSAASERRERDHGRAICTGPFVSTRTTGRASLKTETHKSRPQARLSAFQFRSTARTVDASGLRGFVLPAFRRWLNSVGPFKAARRLFLPLRFNSSQEPKRCIAQSLKSLSCALFHVDNVRSKGSPCPAKEFPNPEKMFPRIP